MARQRTPGPLPPPSADRLDGALQYSEDVARGRARSTRRRPLPSAEFLPTTLEALVRATVASESIREALRLVRELNRTEAERSPLGNAPLVTVAGRLADAGRDVAFALADLERYLGRPTVLDGATVSAGVADRKGAPGG